MEHQLSLTSNKNIPHDGDETDYISTLPDECLVMVIELLTLKDQLECGKINQRWERLVEKFILSRKYIKIEYRQVSEYEKEFQRYLLTTEGFHHVLRCSGGGLISVDLMEAAGWVLHLDLEELGVVDAITSYCHQISTLKLASEISLDGFARLTASLGSNLKTVVMKYSYPATASTSTAHVSMLFANCKHLENLSVPGSAHLTSDAFIDTPKILKKINISRCHSLDNKCLEYLLNSCQDTLEVLDATCCSGFTAGYLNFISQFNNLKVFSLYRTSTFGCGILGNLTKLEELRLLGGRVEDCDLSAIVNGCKRLRLLHVAAYNHNLTPEGFACLGEAKALEDLDVSEQPSFNDESLLIVAKLPHLTHLSLWRCPSVSCDGVKAMAPLASHLEYLDLRVNRQIDDIKVLEAFDSSLPNRKIRINLLGTILGLSLGGISEEQRPKYDNVEYELDLW